MSGWAGRTGTEVRLRHRIIEYRLGVVSQMGTIALGYTPDRLVTLMARVWRGTIPALGDELTGYEQIFMAIFRDAKALVEQRRAVAVKNAAI
jgi:hypothetical protein